MRITVFSMGPLFPAMVHGGSQKTLQTVLQFMGQELGHDCRVFCTRRADNYEPFQLSEGVQVFPSLQFKQTYPEPYYAAPYELRNVIVALRRSLESSDIFYIHDGELLFHFLYDYVPTAVSFQDFVYPDTLAGALTFRRDRLIVSSQYVFECVTGILREFRSLPSAMVRVVPNGFDVNCFRPKESISLRSYLGLKAHEIAVLYPHRPDPRKGLFESIDALIAARPHLPKKLWSSLRLLIPKWVDSELIFESQHVYQNLYEAAQSYAAERDAPELLLIHPWLPPALMPEYYSLGQVTLCLGNFVEAFGNVSVESELCGTPAIVARVAAHRTIIPDNLIRKVDYGDHSKAAEYLAEVITSNPQANEDLRDFVANHYSESRMVEGYAEAILSVRRSITAQERTPEPMAYDDRVSIPPWCAVTEHGYYNDYLYGYSAAPGLRQILKERLPETVGNLLRRGMRMEDLERLVYEGLLLRSSTHYSDE